MIKIFYDHQIFIEQRYGGISRYFYEIIQRIKKKNTANVRLQVFLSRNYYLNNGFHFKIYNKMALKTSQTFLMKINRIISLLHLILGKYDIIHSTYYDPYLLKVKGRAKIIVTVYDMIHELVGGLDDQTIQNKNIMLHAADKIIAISEHTKADLLKVYPDISEKKIAVIYLASDSRNKKGEECSISLPERYVLFVGNRGGYKNFKNFMVAMKIIMEQNLNLFLVCIGGGDFPESACELMKSLEIQDRVVRYDLTDEELAFAYKNAVCFVFPSKYEGFGIPILEAFGNDCPAVLSNTSSLPEVGGEAALYFDPLNPIDIASKILIFVNSEAKRKEYIYLGQKRLSKFSWDKTAEETYALYQEAIEVKAK